MRKRKKRVNGALLNQNTRDGRGGERNEGPSSTFCSTAAPGMVAVNSSIFISFKEDDGTLEDRYFIHA